MKLNKVIQGDCLEKLKELEDNSVDACVTDPPAGISFMGKEWDTDKGGRDHWIKWMQEIATECNRVLKPGGHALVWAIPRTSHWTATAWENAGFQIRDVVAHVFGSGFPKSLNIGKAVDKLQGNEREITGYEGWGTALKPAREDWILMRKPLEKGLSVAENCLKWGTGGINIDGCRVECKGGSPSQDRRQHKTPTGNYNGWDVSSRKGYNDTHSGEDIGRFPTNLIHDGSDEVVSLFPNTKGDNRTSKSTYDKGHWGNSKPVESTALYSDSGSAARYFKKCEIVNTDIHEPDCLVLDEVQNIMGCTCNRFFYCSKASKSERNMGCEELEEKAKVFNGQSAKPSKDMKDVEKRFTTQPKANNHPTVKPIALMEYLVKLVSREGAIVLDPFAGSGSTGLACVNLNRQYILIEREPDYVKICEKRLEYAKKNKDNQQKLL
jgi:site-specific DNA-methyltransferase (adenine-specific)